MFCPCHGGKYDEFGINIGGPPPRPLDIFEPIIQDGNVYIPILNAKERS
ncbi:Rieske 2Fe-2S domain-containing protein (plasmid) [Metabacillus endolithicus]|nr:Rieske 2Fe-2S domain-containing protein [Metabacillus endolithicus]UPG66278.1 Rieske 2Fe-2S domain-containing protein [Metabacillus endolithicus]